MKYILVLLLIVSQLVVVAQEESNAGKKKQRISFGLYHTKAIGHFSSADEDNYRAGFAEIGSAKSIQYQILMTKNSNIVFSFINSNYSFNETGFIDVVGFDRRWINRNVYAENYRVSFFTFGYKFSGGSDLIKGFVNPFFGYSRMIAGEIEVSAKDGPTGDVLRMVQNERSPAHGLAYGINGGVEFYITQWLNLNFELGVIGSAFEIEAEFTAISAQSIELFPAYRLPYSAINIGASIGVTF